MHYATSAFLAVALLSAPAAAPLPEGGTGIASRYPGDAGIESDPAVLFHDDFEGTADTSQLAAKWDAGVLHEGNMRISGEAATVHRGTRALEFTIPQQTAELAVGVSKAILPEQDVLFLRYYAKLDRDFEHIGSSHNGGSISAHYFVNGMATPGIPADGYNKYLLSFENFRFDSAVAAPGELSIYCYWPEQFSGFGDMFMPDGTVYPNSTVRSGAATFGPTFVARPNIIQERDRWYCYEVMLQANTPGQRDGRIACWLDGKLIADFPNLWFRYLDTLKMDRVDLSLHIGSNTIRPNTKWYDDVVVATSYIGPVAASSGGGGGGGRGKGGGCSTSGAPRGGALVLSLILALVLVAWRTR